MVFLEYKKYGFHLIAVALQLQVKIPDHKPTLPDSEHSFYTLNYMNK